MRIKTIYLTAGYLLLVFSIIGGLIWFRFVWLTSQSVKAFTSTPASFQASHLEEAITLPNPIGRPLLVHFIDKDCPCTKYSLPYILELKEETIGSVQHLMSSSLEELHINNRKAVTRLTQALPASPAIAIWDKHGELSFFGPYSSGAYCGDGEDFVRKVLSLFKANKDIQWLDQEALGCLCKWPQEKTVRL